MVLITALLVMVLISAVMVGMFAAVNADQSAQGVDRDQTQSYAAAHAGLEKLTADLMNLFVVDVSPSVAQINNLTNFPPSLSGFQFTAPGGAAGSGYAITFPVDGSGNPQVLPNRDLSGERFGLWGLLTPYTVTVTARSTTGGSEVRMRRDLNTVAIPIFQFGVFSETDLTFYAGDDFDFGGRVHTNTNLFLSELNGFTLTFSDRISAVGQVVRSHLSNGLSVATVGFTGAVRVPVAVGTPGTYRNLRYTGPNEGSILGFPGATPAPALNTNWNYISRTDYNSNITTTATGARRLTLPIVSQGATAIDLIKRPATVNENTTLPLLFGQRYFSTASLRILLSDRDTDITTLPTITATPPVQLDGNWIATPPNNGVAYGPVNATHPPIARSIGPISNSIASGGTYASPLSQINVSALDNGFRVPATMYVGSAAITNCTIKEATRFTCDVGSPGIASGGGTLSAVLPSGVTVSAPTTTAAVSAGSARLITLQNHATTNPRPSAPFSPDLIWVNGTAVTCEGYNTTTPRFTNCRGLSSGPTTSGTISTHAHVTAGTGTIGGFLKIERQNAAGVWSDVTMEILNLGIGAPNQEGTQCADPTPDAVLRLQRLRDNANPTTGVNGGCTYAGSQNAYDWWPNALYDAREGNRRDFAVPTTEPMRMGGVMHYIALDVNNLKRWLAGTIGNTGTTVLNQNGYIVYFSDRRGNHDWTDPGGVIDPETGEYGWEDVVNPLSAAGTPNGVLDAGEDVNVNTSLQTYGEAAQTLAATTPLLSGATSPFSLADADVRESVTSPQARLNRTLLFRRALKLINGGIVGGVNSLPTSGLTVVAENPVYVQGNYNATTDSLAEPNVPAAVMADAVSVLSNNWSDARSFRFPNDRDSRPATITGYRFAVLAGKNPGFVYPTAGSPQFLFGTDGGVGNFLRLLEDWNISGVSINYRGSIVSLYYSRQATGTFRFSPNVYSYGDRNFSFDTDFLQPALIPPGTPMFRDVNVLTFRQVLRPNQ